MEKVACTSNNISESSHEKTLRKSLLIDNSGQRLHYDYVHFHIKIRKLL